MNNKVLSLYDWFLIVGVIASNILYSVLSGNVDIIGSVAGMLVFHHKTQHWYFQAFMPLIALLQMAALLTLAIFKMGWL